MRPDRLRCCALALFVLLPASAHAQEAMSKAFDLERRGNYAAAAQAYRAVLAGKPGDVAALLGLERSLLPLNRPADILPEVRAALASAPRTAAVYGVAVRAWAAAGQPDSVRALAERWARLDPTDESPYREWGAAALAMRDRAGARTAYRLGRERIGRPDALAPEIAQMASEERDYATALQEWLLAVRQIPEYRLTAVAALADAPAGLRPDLLRQLAAAATGQPGAGITSAGSPSSPNPATGRDSTARPAAAGTLTIRRLEAELRAHWGDPLGGLTVLQSALPVERAAAVEVLREFLDQVRALPSPDARRAEGRVVEALAAKVPEPEASRLRLDAARAYAEAGDREAARRMLAGLADDKVASGTIAAEAGTALIGVLIAEGKLDEASRRLEALRPAPDQYAALRRRLALGWARAGDLARAESAIAADSSVEGLAVSGRIRLYRGDIAGAVERLTAAGPFAGERADATQRTQMLALLQPLEADSLPALGGALLQVEQGDTARGVAALERIADGLPPAKGGAELRLYAGRLAAAAGRPEDAERLFRAAAIQETPATAAAAELALGELLLARGRADEAVKTLEHLILTYPQSAVVPQARRRLDEARGAVPKT